LFFNDWWLPNDWSRQICTPDRGTFPAVNMSASASTVMLIGPRGNIYTRLYDFDTGGENSLLEYSYIIDGPSGTTRKLPSEDWRLQPPITEGFITKRITVFQTGKGNAARTLRVEGVLGGERGYFEKGIYDPAWTFVYTGEPRSNPIINDPAHLPPVPEPTEPLDYVLSGTLTKNGQTIEVELTNFNMVCSPADARLYVNGQLVLAGGQPFVLKFHHVHTMVEDIRPLEYWLLGAEGKIQAALIIGDTISQIDDASVRNTLTSFFTNQSVINFVGFVGLNAMEADEIPWDMPFRVPGNEKSFLTGFSLSLSRPAK
ncbi:hypothetical protein KKF84_21700, partial [Myxococcota bacterium]|nr:hypothetical protein [Myxococcota bacterium]MBU1537942.1 hypothetical protein [Myxococcota bacterium]